jgi:hypothetical protein
MNENLLHDATYQQRYEELVSITCAMQESIDRLKRACHVLYYVADDGVRRLAENEFSGCASTQRDNPYELEKYLGYKKKGRI